MTVRSWEGSKYVREWEVRHMGSGIGVPCVEDTLAGTWGEALGCGAGGGAKGKGASRERDRNS